jgi:hypothetical protein
MNVEASQDGSQRGQLLFRRTSAACNMLSDKLQHVRIHSEGSSSQLCAPPPPPGAAGPMSQEGGQQLQRDSSLPPRQPSQQLLMRGLTIDTTRYPSQSDMAWWAAGRRAGGAVAPLWPCFAARPRSHPILPCTGGQPHRPAPTCRPPPSTPDYATPVDQQFHVDYDIGGAWSNGGAGNSIPARFLLNHARLRKFRVRAWP